MSILQWKMNRDNYIASCEWSCIKIFTEETRELAAIVLIKGAAHTFKWLIGRGMLCWAFIYLLYEIVFHCIECLLAVSLTFVQSAEPESVL
ncbi:Hypothetical predicted protein, partial [Paramuricea clavata]